MLQVFKLAAFFLCNFTPLIYFVNGRFNFGITLDFYRMRMMYKRYFWLYMFICLALLSHKSYLQTTAQPLRIVVAGITHGHVPWILSRKPGTGIELVGIFETNKELARRYADEFNLDPGLFYTDLDKMLDEVKPEALAAFGSIYEHMAAIESAAPRGIHVMVEKPVATNMKHALRMQALAKQYNIHILTNYETSWFPTTHQTYKLVKDSLLVGAIKKVVVHDGHQGPKEIGVNKEFLEWLTDSIQNGGGALIDFGCYGANLMTWLMEGEKPLSVTAVTRQFKPAIYPQVDDEATIIISYPSAQCIIQASWNWPQSRKDLEVYGETGYVIAVDDKNMRTRYGDQPEQSYLAEIKYAIPEADPFLYLSGVIRGKIKIPPYGLYSLENNLMVVRILEAARLSAQTGKTIKINY